MWEIIVGTGLFILIVVVLSFISTRMRRRKTVISFWSAAADKWDNVANDHFLLSRIKGSDVDGRLKVQHRASANAAQARELECRARVRML